MEKATCTEKGLFFPLSVLPSEHFCSPPRGKDGQERLGGGPGWEGLRSPTAPSPAGFQRRRRRRGASCDSTGAAQGPSEGFGFMGPGGLLSPPRPKRERPVSRRPLLRPRDSRSPPSPPPKPPCTERGSPSRLRLRR